MAKSLCSSIILAGASTIPRGLVSLLKSRCEETILVAIDPLQHLDFDGLIVADTQGRPVPFSAIYAGLFAAVHPHALVVDGRYTGLKPALVQEILDVVAPRWDLVITRTPAGLDPCLAVYSKRCLKPMEQHLARATFSPEALWSKLNKFELAPSELQTYDPEDHLVGRNP